MFGQGKSQANLLWASQLVKKAISAGLLPAPRNETQQTVVYTGKEFTGLMPWKNNLGGPRLA